MKKFISYFFFIVVMLISQKSYAQGDCVCEYGSATQVGDFCYIVNACSDPLASNYCEGTNYLSENCIYSGSEGCTCEDADNYEKEFGMEYDGRVYLESIDLTCSHELVEKIVEEVYKLFTEAECPEDTPEKVKHDDKLNRG